METPFSARERKVRKLLISWHEMESEWRERLNSSSYLDPYGQGLVVLI